MYFVLPKIQNVRSASLYQRLPEDRRRVRRDFHGAELAALFDNWSPFCNLAIATDDDDDDDDDDVAPLLAAELLGRRPGIFPEVFLTIARTLNFTPV